MTSPNLETRAQPRNRNPDNPLSLFIAFLRDRKIKSEVDQRRQFKDFVLSEGYEDFRDAIVDEWIRIKHSTALQAANPPSIASIKAKAAKRREVATQQDALTARAETKIVARMAKLSLDFMIGQAPLRDCIGTDLSKLSGWIGRVGQHVGNKRVGDILKTDAQLLAVIK